MELSILGVYFTSVSCRLTRNGLSFMPICLFIECNSASSPYMFHSLAEVKIRISAAILITVAIYDITSSVIIISHFLSVKCVSIIMLSNATASICS